MSKLNMSNAANLNLEQIMLAMDLEERHLKTNKQPVSANPDDYDAYLNSMCGREGAILTFDQYEALKMGER